jgi:putative methylase
MGMVLMKKKELEIILSRLKEVENKQLDLEQYQTDANIAADLLWSIHMRGDLNEKIIADLGCGNGVLGIGALLLGAKKLYFVDVDEKSIKITRENVKFVENEMGVKFDKSFFKKDISVFSKKVDVVLQNPPFGVQRTHADKAFLIKAMRCGEKIYSFHKIETQRFVEKFAYDEEWKSKLIRKYDFPLRIGKDKNKGYKFWKKKVHFVDVGVWLFWQ